MYDLEFMLGYRDLGKKDKCKDKGILVRAYGYRYGYKNKCKDIWINIKIKG